MSDITPLEGYIRATFSAETTNRLLGAFRAKVLAGAAEAIRETDRDHYYDESAEGIWLAAADLVERLSLTEAEGS